MAVIAVELATAYVTLVPSARGMGAALEKEMGGAGATASRSFGAAFLPGLASVGKAAAKGLTGVTLAAVGVGAALYKVGSSFHDAYATIRVGTGATGAALDGLKDDFKAVASSSASSFGEVATTISGLNRRLGLTGDPLQNLSTQFLKLSRITKTDLSTNIQTITRVIGDWQISTEAMPGALDKIFRASQASGIGLDQLSQSVVQFGAPLRNLGFGFDEALALISQFDKAGVNTSTVFAGLKVGVGKMAKAGEKIPATFRRVVDEITKLGPGTEATAKAIELFGQRSGPDLADAIAGGKFEIDGMLDSISNGTDTIAKAAKATGTFSGKLKILKNKVLLELEPVATRVFDAVNQGAVDIGAGFSGKDTDGVFGWIGATARTAYDFVNDVAVPGIRDAVGRLIAGFAGLDKTGFFGGIGDGARKAFDFVRDAAGKALGFVRDVAIPGIIGAGVDLAAGFSGEDITGIFGRIGDGARTAFDFIGDAAGKALAFVRDVAIPGIKQAISDVIAGFTGDDATGIFGRIGDGARTALDYIKETALPGIKQAGVDLAAGFSGEDTTGIFGRIGDAARVSYDFIRDTAVPGIIQAVSDLKAGIAGDDKTGFFGGLGDKARTTFDFIKITALPGIKQAVESFVSGLTGKGGEGSFFVDLAEAAQHAWRLFTEDVLPVLKTVATFIKDHLAPIVGVLVVGLLLLAGPIVLIAALVAGFIYAYQKSEVFRDVVAAVFAVIKEVLIVTIDAFKLLWTEIVAAFDIIKWVVVTAWNFIEPTFNTIVSFVRDILIPIWGDMVGAVVAAWDAVPGIISTVLQKIGGLIANFLAGAANLATALGLPEIGNALAAGARSASSWGQDSAGATDFGSGNIGVGGGLRRAQGGPIPGPNVNRDVVPILATPGEYMVRKAAVDRYGLGFFNAINNGQTPAAAGGDRIEHLHLTTVANANADEVVAAINAKLGWAHTSRRDR